MELWPNGYMQRQVANDWTPSWQLGQRGGSRLGD